MVLAKKRRCNGMKGFSDKHLQGVVLMLMKKIDKCVGDVCRREYRGGNFGENRRTTLVYLFSTNINGDLLATTDRTLGGCPERTMSSVNSCRRSAVTVGMAAA